MARSLAVVAVAARKFATSVAEVITKGAVPLSISDTSCLPVTFPLESLATIVDTVDAVALFKLSSKSAFKFVTNPVPVLFIVVKLAVVML